MAAFYDHADWSYKVPAKGFVRVEWHRRRSDAAALCRRQQRGRRRRAQQRCALLHVA
jgi:hypothetical protein